MKKTLLNILLPFILFSCASTYKVAKPENMNYSSTSTNSDVQLSYKYDILPKKYSKKEVKRGIKLVSVKLTNNTNKDLTFGDNLKLTDDLGKEIYTFDKETTFKKLKQLPATHLFYLLLTPVNFFTTTQNSNGTAETNSTPVGLILGPGLALGNLAVASSANSKFKKDLELYNLNGAIIKKGETKYGLIAFEADSFESLKVKVSN